MGILVITWNFPPRRGGIEYLISSICEGLRKTHPLFVITSFAPSVSSREEGIFRPKGPGLLFFSLYALWQGSLLLWRNPGIKAILGGSAVVSPIILILARVFRRKAVVSVHGSDVIYSGILYQALCVRSIRYCDRLVANSSFTASLAERKKAKKNLISIIPPGVDWEFFATFRADGVRKEMGLEGKKVLLYVGRLVRRKGLKEFLQKSFPKIVVEAPEVCFLIIGENPAESLIPHDDVAGELKTLVHDMGLESHVRLLGGLSNDDIAKIYRISDLVVLPVLSMKDDVEGFGIVILEAAAAEKPCVATRVGGIPDAIDDGKSGILVEPEDYELMSRTIVSLLRDDQTRSALGEYAQRRVKEKFGSESIAGKYDELFAALSAG